MWINRFLVGDVQKKRCHIVLKIEEDS